IVDGERERAAAPAGADVEREATASRRHGLRRRHALDSAEQVEGRYQTSAEHVERPAVAPIAERTEDALDARGRHVDVGERPEAAGEKQRVLRHGTAARPEDAAEPRR